MDWTIYSFGATKYLESVFNAIAMYSNSGNFDGMFKIALGIGIIIITIQCILDGGKTIKFQMPAIAIVIYMAMFSATTRVQIEDTYTGNSTAVDNVPYGVVVIGSIISTVGHSITEGMEQAFSTPGMTKYGMIDPLVTISSAKDTFSSPMTLAMMAGGNMTMNMSESIKNYLNDCTMRDVIEGSKTLSGIYSSKDGIDSLATSNPAIYTKIYDSTGTNSTAFNPSRASLLTCDNAWAKIKNFLTANEVKAWNLAACRSNGSQSSSDAVVVNCNSGGATSKARVDSAINYLGLLNQTSSDMQAMMILGPFLDKAAVRKENSLFQDASAIQRSSALDQQNVALAGKGSAFLTWAQPLMTFIQGMIFGITPFMVFVLGLGLMGLKMIAKYFLVLVWVQLWFPILAIINMYIITRTADSLAVINTQGMSFDTLAEALKTITLEAGLAGNLIAATPALAGFIVWGSSVAFSSMASQLTGSQGLDAKTIAPDMTSAAPVIQQSAAYESNSAQGVRASGTDAATGTLNSSQVLGASVSSSTSRMKTAQETLGHEVSSNLQRGLQAANTVGKGSQFQELYNNNLTKAMGGGTTSGVSLNTGMSSGQSEKSNTSSQQNQTIGGSVSAGFQALGTGAVAKADVKSSHGSGHDNTNDRSISEGSTVSQGATDSATLQNATSEQKAAALIETLNQTKSYTSGSTNSEGIKRALSESNTASEEYRAVEQLSESQGTGFQMPMLQAAKTTLGLNSQTSSSEREERMAAFSKMFEGKETNAGEPLKEFVGRKAESLQAQDPSLSYETAYGVAGIMGLSKSGDLGQLLASSISPIMSGGSEVNPNKNSHVKGPSSSKIDNLQDSASRVESGVNSNINDGAAMTARSPDSNFTDNKSRVSDAQERGEGAATMHANQSKVSIETERNQKAADRIMDGASKRNNDDSFSKNHAHVSEMASNALSKLISDPGQDPQSKAFLNHYNHAMGFDGISSAQAAVYASSKSDFAETTELGRSVTANAYQDAMKLSGNNDTYARGVIESMRSVSGTSGVDSDQRLAELSNANKAMTVEGYNKEEFSINPNQMIHQSAGSQVQPQSKRYADPDVPYVESNSKN